MFYVLPIYKKILHMYIVHSHIQIYIYIYMYILHLLEKSNKFQISTSFLFPPTDLNPHHFHSSHYLTITEKPELRLNSMIAPAIMDFWIFHFCLYDRAWPFISIISFYELHSFFRYLILKLEKQRQPVANYIETSTCCKSFPLPPFNQCCWVCNLN